MHNSQAQDLWLEPVLERHLGQVVAPDRLWDAVQHPRISRPKTRAYASGPLLAAAAIVVATFAVWILVARNTLSRETLALQALTREPEDLDFRSGAVSEIRAWVKSKTGLDIALPSITSKAVQVTGVCAVKGGMPAVEVSYRVAGHKAALVVSKAGRTPSAEGQHRSLKCESVGHTRVSSWTMDGQLYTLAYAAIGDARSECLLCHVAGEPHI